MYIAQYRNGHVYAFESKQPEPNSEYFRYFNFIELKISFDEAIANKEILKAALPLIKTNEHRIYNKMEKEIKI